jgi:hypothetical protein
MNGKMKMVVFFVVALCGLTEVYRRRDDALKMETAKTSETLKYF